MNMPGDVPKSEDAPDPAPAGNPFVQFDSTQRENPLTSSNIAEPVPDGVPLPPSEASISSSKPGNHVLLVIVATVFCFPLGIIAALLAVDAAKHWKAGRHADAAVASIRVQVISFAAIIVTLLVLGFGLGW